MARSPVPYFLRNGAFGSAPKPPRPSARTTRRISASAAIATVVPVVDRVRAASLEDAEAAIEQGEVAKAVDILRPLAESGDADAQFRLGCLHADRRRGGERDAAEAARWMGRAAERQTDYAW